MHCIHSPYTSKGCFCGLLPLCLRQSLHFLAKKPPCRANAPMPPLLELWQSTLTGMGGKKKRALSLSEIPYSPANYSQVFPPFLLCSILAEPIITNLLRKSSVSRKNVQKNFLNLFNCRYKLCIWHQLGGILMNFAEFFRRYAKIPIALSLVFLKSAVSLHIAVEFEQLKDYNGFRSRKKEVNYA